MITIKLLDIGTRPYGEVLDLQQQLFDKAIQAKLNGQPVHNRLILCEHPPVFTLGKSGKRENILVSDEQMQAEFYQVSRGGDVTFHGPGQLVAYPILDLESLSISVNQYIHQLEEVMIQSIKHYGLTGERIEGAAGIWLRENDTLHDRKIGAIGAKVSRLVTMHGLAININTQLSYFAKIMACGIEDKGVTSLQKELGKEIPMDSYKQLFTEAFSKVFSVALIAEQLS